MFSSKSPAQIEAAKIGLRMMNERNELKRLHDQEFGSCYRCQEDLIINNPKCHDCINGGGVLKLFREKPTRRQRR